MTLGLRKSFRIGSGLRFRLRPSLTGSAFTHSPEFLKKCGIPIIDIPNLFLWLNKPLAHAHQAILALMKRQSGLLQALGHSQALPKIAEPAIENMYGCLDGSEV